MTADSPAAAEKICSARPVDGFHGIAITEALAQRKPLVVIFATPGFCRSQMCGPVLEEVQTATAQYGDRLNVIHVEIYQNARPPQMVPAVAQWGLPSEPWVFLVGADGRIVDKFESAVTADELHPAVAQLVRS
ncbi:MAG: hypothetical protein HY689_13660 [Chloroflexi bacterium]|nr:hypothetical protein [Chloroflexota bacterium]